MPKRSPQFSYGGTAGIVISMSLIIGLYAASATRVAIVSGLLIVAIADNLTDALSIHIYQESQRLEPRQAFRLTLSNFGTRLLISLSFVLLVVFLPMGVAVVASVIWGLFLLSGLTYIIARERQINFTPEIIKHVSVAATVILASQIIGKWIVANLH